MKEKINFFKKNILKVILIICLIIFTRIAFYYILGPDYINCLKNWYSDIIENGKFNSLGLQIGNYTPPYIFLLTIGTYLTDNSLFWVKYVSFVFDIVMAIYACLIVKQFNMDKYKKVFIYTLILPGVIINSAVLGQCDSIYTAFVLMFVYYILKDKIKFAMFLFGIALSFKLQAIFIAPIILYLLITKKVKLFDIIYIGFGFLTFMLPSMFYGKTLIDIIMVYVEQTKVYPQLVRSAPNIYSWFGFNYFKVELVIKYILSAICIGVSIFVTMHGIKKNICKFDSNTFIIKLMLLSLIVPYLLPGMMDRYFYMANIFLLINLFINKNICKLNIKLFILASIAYFIPVFTINFFQQNNNTLWLSESIGITLISSTINTYVIYKYFQRYVLSDMHNRHKNVTNM